MVEHDEYVDIGLKTDLCNPKCRELWENLQRIAIPVQDVKLRNPLGQIGVESSVNGNHYRGVVLVPGFYFRGPDYILQFKSHSVEKNPGVYVWASRSVVGSPLVLGAVNAIFPELSHVIGGVIVRADGETKEGRVPCWLD